jgi:hypothetical protein
MIALFLMLQIGPVDAKFRLQPGPAPLSHLWRKEIRVGSADSATGQYQSLRDCLQALANDARLANPNLMRAGCERIPLDQLAAS